MSIPVKVIVVTGGVLSGLGKGVAAASIGHLLSGQYSVTPIKCDGYLNVDPGTMNPFEHGEVFVLDDGAEVDMDFGHYERFLGVSCKTDHSITMGKVYQGVIEKERRGDYLGEDVQLFPHVSEYIQEKILEAGKDSDVILVEIGGTVGDIENEMFVMAMRDLERKLGRQNVLFVHLSYVPKPPTLGEHKTKPTQQSVQLLMQRGITPDIIIARAEEPISRKEKEKIKLFCGSGMVVSGHDMRDVYEIPQSYYDQGILAYINGRLGIEAEYDQRWEKRLQTLRDATKTVRIGVAGKYTNLEDSYASIAEALKHCSAHEGVRVQIEWIETTGLRDVSKLLDELDGVIVPGGFGTRGIEGKIRIIEYCRENNIPFLGICYGMQLAVVEFARNMCGLDANTTEADANTKHPVIDILPEQLEVSNKGGTMRLGAWDASLKEGIIFDLYGKEKVSERHRHRYEVNPEYHSALTEQGLVLSGMNGKLTEFIELPSHKYFVGTQAHPELKSTLDNPAPLFLGLVRAAKK